jgi:hypothetical protein
MYHHFVTISRLAVALPGKISPQWQVGNLQATVQYPTTAFTVSTIEPDLERPNATL